jgi:hypothetical protein
MKKKRMTMSEQLDMTGIDEERLRRFVRDGKSMDEEEISFFLDSPCLELTLRNFPAQLAGEYAGLQEIRKGILAGISTSDTAGTVHIKMWMPAFHITPLMNAVRKLYSDAEMENPYEFMDLEQMDAAGPGREYVTAMLICARDAGQDIS